MALRDQPYLPLYVMDVLTDEKLAECSEGAHGVLFRLMCILHKQEKYGLLCLKQKYKQTASKFENFASMISRQMPFEQKQIQKYLEELDAEGVIVVTDDTLWQKRMLRDGELSLVRSEVGKIGGSVVTKQYGKPGFLYWITDHQNNNKIGVSKNPQNRLYRLRSDLKMTDLIIERSIEVSDMGLSDDLALEFFKDRDGEWVKLHYNEVKDTFALLEAKVKAKNKAIAVPNTENENENSNSNNGSSIKTIPTGSKGTIEGGMGETKSEPEMLTPKMISIFKEVFPKYRINIQSDPYFCGVIANHIADQNEWPKESVTNGRMAEILEQWRSIAKQMKSDSWFSTRTLKDLSEENMFKRLMQKINNQKDHQDERTSKHVVGKTHPAGKF